MDTLELVEYILHGRLRGICMCWSMGGEVEPLKLFENIVHCRIEGICVFWLLFRNLDSQEPFNELVQCGRHVAVCGRVV